MDDAESMTSLVQRWRSGDQAAARAIVDRYAGRLAGLARRHLAPQLAPRVDHEDVVQSAFRTFFRRLAAGNLHVQPGDHLWRLLARITLLKARALARFHAADQRSFRAEAADAEAWLTETAARDPGPEDAILLLDEIDALLDGCPPLHSHILALRLDGYDNAHIAERLNVSTRTVQRALRLLQQRLAERDPASGFEDE